METWHARYLELHHTLATYVSNLRLVASYADERHEAELRERILELSRQVSGTKDLKTGAERKAFAEQTPEVERTRRLAESVGLALEDAKDLLQAVIAARTSMHTRMEAFRVSGAEKQISK